MSILEPIPSQVHVKNIKEGLKELGVHSTNVQSDNSDYLVPISSQVNDQNIKAGIKDMYLTQADVLPVAAI